MTDIIERVTSIIYAAIDELNEQLAEENRLARSPETPLLGSAGRLDSIGFVNLIVLVEEKCQDEFRVCMSLPDTLATTEGNPLQTVGSFIDYMSWLVEKEVSA
jgi:acyl carrier protein